MIQEMKQKFKTIIEDKKGQGVGGMVTGLIGGLVFIVIMVALLPTIFGNSGLGNSTFLASTPSWLATALPVVVGAGILFGALAYWKLR